MRKIINRGKMKLKHISDNEYELYLQNKQGVSLQMQLEMVKIYRNNGWDCQPIGLFTAKNRLEMTGTFDSISSEVYFKDEEELVGVAMLAGKPLKFAGMYYTCQYGPYLESYDKEYITEFFRLVLPILKGLKCSQFSCNPNNVETRYDLEGRVIERFADFDQQILLDLGYSKKDLAIDTNGQIDMRYMYKKNLDFNDIESLRASYRSSVRREVNNAHNNMVEIEELDFKHLEHFTKLMRMSGDKHGFRVHGSEYYKQLKDNFGEAALVLVATVNCPKFLAEMENRLATNNQLIESYAGDNRKGRITKLEEVNERIKKMCSLVLESPDIIEDRLYLSAGVYIKTNDQLIHFLSGNDITYAKFNSSTLMQDYAMRYALREKVPVFNMYGVSGTFEKNDSVFRFKTGFDGYVDEYIGTFEYKLAPLRLKIISYIKRITKKN